MVAIQPNLELKTRPKQLLGSLPLVIALPGCVIEDVEEGWMEWRENFEANYKFANVLSFRDSSSCGATTLTPMTFSRMTFSITTLSIMTISILVLSKITFSTMTLSKQQSA
jgi:hypothetical protein